MNFFSFNSYVLDFGLEGGVLGLGLGLGSCGLGLGLGLEVCALGLALALGVMSLLTSLLPCGVDGKTDHRDSPTGTLLTSEKRAFVVVPAVAMDAACEAAG